MNPPPIDFVITWVDGNDPEWQKKKFEHTGVGFIEGNTEVRYRDWNTLKFWFRGVEKFAPWVRYIYFVTDKQKPSWLNLEHPKLKWISHSDFIPKEYLPTFNSNVIEWNLHRINGLSECFVYFNDDMFLINKTVPDDFFKQNLPCDFPVLSPLYPSNFFSYLMVNNICLLNRHFSLRNSIKANKKKWVKNQSIWGLCKLALYGRHTLIPGINGHHIHISYLKKNFQLLWEKEYNDIHSTCKNKLRSKNDLTTWCVRDWQLLSGEFYPKKPIGKLFQTSELNHSKELLTYLQKQKGKVICLNDTETEDNFELHQEQIISAFKDLFPEKSSFEL